VRDSEQLRALDALHDQLQRRGIDYWLFGGWAVDFHAGAVTRSHADLDIAIWHEDYERIAGLLGADGWSHSPEPGEDGSTAYEREGVRLELAFLARDEDGEVYTPLRDGRAGWAEGAFVDDVRELRGVEARVISLGSLKVEKSQTLDDPVATAKDRADLTTLSDL
jgi:hypothetical protein